VCPRSLKSHPTRCSTCDVTARLHGYRRPSSRPPPPPPRPQAAAGAWAGVALPYVGVCEAAGRRRLEAQEAKFRERWLAQCGEEQGGMGTLVDGQAPPGSRIGERVPFLPPPPRPGKAGQTPPIPLPSIPGAEAHRRTVEVFHATSVRRARCLRMDAPKGGGGGNIVPRTFPLPFEKCRLDSGEMFMRCKPQI